MMTIKEMNDLLKIYGEDKYDKWELKLWDYQNQRDVDWNVSHSSSRDDKSIVFPVSIPPADGVSVFEKLQKLVKENDKKHASLVELCNNIIKDFEKGDESETEIFWRYIFKLKHLMENFKNDN